MTSISTPPSPSSSPSSSLSQQTQNSPSPSASPNSSSSSASPSPSPTSPDSTNIYTPPSSFSLSPCVRQGLYWSLPLSTLLGLFHFYRNGRSATFRNSLKHSVGTFGLSFTAIGYYCKKGVKNKYEEEEQKQQVMKRIGNSNDNLLRDITEAIDIDTVRLPKTIQQILTEEKKEDEENRIRKENYLKEMKQKKEKPSS